MKRIYTLGVSLLMVATFANAQTISHSVVASAGENYTNSETGISISWTLGEPVIGTLTSDDESIILTQGFQQGMLGGDVYIVTLDFSAEITVYPNPATNFVNIKVDGLINGALKLEVLDIHGRIRAEHNNITNDDLVTIKADHLNSGVYMLRFISGDQTVKTVRLIKE
ncbi:MAG: T9SS type A sorting domain-containing protein [Salinivirgaceae bacterium]|nr:T9SS type A sorting domain-containing protein [Salinivirgaceae bacterium]MDY0280330.1 T9SS type A sorting domain-containing protein [Salinivirgaceae bacterium]